MYDTEVQQKDTGNLPMRSRYYQGMLDSTRLDPGETDFNNLGKVFIIMIMPFDLFGQGKYMYTFQNICKEVPGLELEDGATRIFLNTHGKNDDEVSEELVHLLHYIEYTNDVDEEMSDERLRRLQRNVKNIQQNAEVGVKYMQLWEEMAHAKQEGHEAGLKEGMSKGISIGESRFAKLTSILLGQGKTDELKRASDDEDYRKELYETYGL